MDDIKKLMDTRLSSVEEKMRDMDATRNETRHELKEIIVAVHENQLQVVKVAGKVEQLFADERAALAEEITAAVVSSVIKALKTK